MKEKTKKILKISLRIANVLVIIGAVVVLGYYLIWKKVESNLIQKGANMVVGQILYQIDQTGEIKINDITLIKK